MKGNLIKVVALLVVAIACQVKAETRDYASLVNPLVGTASTYELSNGNTYPSISLPWGMNSWTPQTGKNGDGWTYQYQATKWRGMKQTHQPSPWINDYGAFSLMPTIGAVVFDEEKRASWFSHKAEAAHPYRYDVYLASFDTRLSLVPTERTAMLQLLYPRTSSSHLVIDAYEGGSAITVDLQARTITGFASNNHGGVPEGFRNYFVIKLNCDIDSVALFLNGSRVNPSQGKIHVEGKHAGAVLTFNTTQGKPVVARVASSFISTEQALVNLQREQGNADMQQLESKAKAHWNEMLGRVDVRGGRSEDIHTFYTALYRMLLFPRAFHEVTAQGDTVHYSPYNGKVERGLLFTDNGFWDTFRAVFPFLTLVYPDVSEQILKGLVNTYRESGWLPEWASPGHRDCMIGSNSASIIADAYLKGIRGFDIQTLWEALMKNTRQQGPLSSVGRRGADWYNKLGYVPYNVGINENAARTLEYAYDDFCLWQLGKALKRPKKEINLLAQRARNYRNVIDPAVGFARGRNVDGSFQSPFRPDKWGDAFTEGCAWHWTWCVFHDPVGLMQMMGGKERFVERLDSVFVAAPTFDDSYYGQQIHEITEMLVAGMGQYAHGNQPIQHAPYLYNWAGQPWKTQYRVRQVMRQLYLNAPDGLCGDEDNGQTSAWYVFSALGFYPVAPGTGQYAVGSPLFRRAMLRLPHNREIKIEAYSNKDDFPYIDSLQLDGKSWSANYLRHEDLVKGRTLLRFTMSRQPNYLRGTKVQDAPYSMSNENDIIVNNNNLIKK